MEPGGLESLEPLGSSLSRVALLGLVFIGSWFSPINNNNNNNNKNNDINKYSDWNILISYFELKLYFSFIVFIYQKYKIHKSFVCMNVTMIGLLDESSRKIRNFICSDLGGDLNRG